MKKDLIIPAVLGLSVFTQNSEVNLANNTTMILALLMLLENQQEVEELKIPLRQMGMYPAYPTGMNYPSGMGYSYYGYDPRRMYY